MSRSAEFQSGAIERLFHATRVEHLESIQAKGLEDRISVLGRGVQGFHTLEEAQGYGQRTGKHAVVEFRPTKITSTFKDIKGRPVYSSSEAVPVGNIVRIHQ